MIRVMRKFLFGAAGLLAAAPVLPAQRQGVPRDMVLVAHRDSLEKELEAVAVIDRKLMIPMRDGVKMQFDVYRPKDVARSPAIFSRTPYNMNYWDVKLGAPADMTAALTAVKRGYAYVVANERGHFYSEGNYDILGPPLTDGVDEIQWISSAVVQWQGGTGRVLVYCGMADGRRCSGTKGTCGDQPAGFWCWRRACEAVLRAG